MARALPINSAMTSVASYVLYANQSVYRFVAPSTWTVIPSQFPDTSIGSPRTISKLVGNVAADSPFAFCNDGSVWELDFPTLTWSNIGQTP